MNTIALKLKFKGVITQPPRASTLWGHLAWWKRYTEGVKALEGWLEEFKNNPPFLLSSAFPEGYLPRPMVKPVLIEQTELRKRIRKVQYLSFEQFRAVASQGENALVKNPPESVLAIKPNARVRVGIDRQSGAAREQLLFSDNSLGLRGIWVIYAKERAAGQQAWLEEALQGIGTMGLGGKASIGYGAFDLISVSSVELPEASNPNAQVTLSPTTGQDGLYFQLEQYWGRLGGAFSGAEVPFKRPYLRAIEGSVFPIANLRGTLLEVTPTPAPEPGVHIYDYLYAFPLGVRV